MKKLLFLMLELLFAFQVYPMMQQQFQFSSIELSKIENTDLVNLEKEIKSYLSTNASVSHASSSSTIPQFEILYEQFKAYKAKIGEYNAYVALYNAGNLSQVEKDAYQSTLSDEAIKNTLTIDPDTLQQYKKHIRVLIASKNIDPVWQIQQSIQKWGLLYGPFVGTCSFLKNICMPRNISANIAATAGFLSAFMLLKNTPQSDVNNSILKASIFCIAGSATAVAVTQLYNGLRARDSKEKLMNLNDNLKGQNLGLSTRFALLDQSIIGIKTRQEVQDLTEASSLQHQSTQQIIQNLADTNNVQHQSTQQQLQANLSATAIEFEQAERSRAAAEQRNIERNIACKAQLDTLQAGQAGLETSVDGVNKLLKQLCSTIKLSKKEFLSYLHDEAHARDRFENNLKAELGTIQWMQLQTFLNGEKQLHIATLTARALGLSQESMHYHHSCMQQHMPAMSIVPKRIFTEASVIKPIASIKSFSLFESERSQLNHKKIMQAFKQGKLAAKLTEEAQPAIATEINNAAATIIQQKLRLRKKFIVK